MIKYIDNKIQIGDIVRYKKDSLFYGMANFGIVIELLNEKFYRYRIKWFSFKEDETKKIKWWDITKEMKEEIEKL